MVWRNWRPRLLRSRAPKAWKHTRDRLRCAEMTKSRVIEPREAVRKMAPYSPPTGGRAEKLRLDFNENTMGCSPRVIEALARYATASELTIYPEYGKTVDELGAFFGISREEFTVTNGTDEAIQIAI